MKMKRILIVVGIVFLGLINAFGQACVSPPANLVSWWRAENDPFDSVGGNNGTLFGGSYTTGKVCQAFILDGYDDYVSIPDAANLDFGSTDPISVEMWAYRTGEGAVMHMIGKREAACGGNINYQMAFDPEHGMLFNAASSWTETGGVYTHVAMPMNQWVHLAATFDGTNFLFYMNGTQIGSGTGTLGPANDEPLMIGSSGSCPFFEGLLDEVSLYNRTLTAGEILAIYNAGKAGKCVGTPVPVDITGWWKAEDNATDSIGGNDGTLLGGSYTTGKVCQAFVLDGYDDYVSIPDAANLDFGATDPISVEMWAYRTGEGTVMHMIGKREAACGGNINYQMAFDPEHGLLFNAADSWTETGGVYTYVAMPMNEWVHLAATFDGTDFLFYLNGVQIGSGTGTLGPANDEPLMIGSSGSCPFFEGLLDEVSLYHRALNAGEIQAIYNAGKAGKYACAVAPTNMISWWRAENDPLDSVGGNNGTLVGGSYVPGKVCQAFSLDGYDDYVSVPDAANLDFGATNSISVEMWAYRTGEGTVMHMIGKREEACGGNINYQMAFDPENGMLFNAADSWTETGGVYTHVTMPMNEWVHLAATFDGTYFRFYMNGALIGTGTGTLGPTNDEPLTIGTSGGCPFFEGLLDEVSLYNRALSAGEIQAIYNAGKAGKCRTRCDCGC